MRPGSSMGARPGSAMGAREGFTGGGARSSSDLTFGSNTALCGNITSALRKRKKDVAETPAIPQDELLPHEREGYSEGEKNKAEPEIMVITHDDSPPAGYVSGESPPVSPVVFDEGEDAEAEPGDILESWD